MKRWITGLLVLVGLVCASPKASSAAPSQVEIWLANSGSSAWNESPSGAQFWNDYYVPPGYSDWFNAVFYRANYYTYTDSNGYRHFYYDNTADGAPSHGSGCLFYDQRSIGDSIDKGFIVFTSSFPWSVDASAYLHNPQAACAVTVNATVLNGNYYDLWLSPPTGSYWSVWMVSFNAWRPDETALTLIAHGDNTTSPQSITTYGDTYGVSSGP